MKEVNTTLRKYLEVVVSKISPEKSEKLIGDENIRLEHVEDAIRLARFGLYRYLTGDIKTGVKLEITKVRQSMEKANTVDELAEILKSSEMSEDEKERIDKITTGYRPESEIDFIKIKKIIK